jgi:hypothetical protein
MACAAYFIERSEEAKTLPEDVPAVITTAKFSLKENASTIKKLVLHFSLKRNLIWLYDTTKPTQSIAIMFGMK